MNITKSMLLGGILAAFLGSGLSAQEGQYRGPEEEVRRPGGGGAAGNTGGGGGDVLPGSIPGVPGGRGDGRTSGTTVARRRIVRYDQEGYNRWEFWWEHNKDRYLVLWNLENRSEEIPLYGTPEYYLGKQDETRPGLMYGLSESDRKDKVIPALLQGLRSPSAEVRGASVIALGKTRDVSVLDALKKATSDPDPDVRHLAILSMGLLGDLEVVPGLLRLLGDERASSEQRFHSAVALGFLRKPEITPYLVTFLQRYYGTQGRGIDDVQLGVLLGLSILGDRSATPFLQILAKDGRVRDDGVRAQLYETMGRIGDLLALPVLLRVLETGEIQERRSAAVALGELDFSPEAEKELSALIGRKEAWAEKDLLTKVALEEFDRLIRSKLDERRQAERKMKRFRDRAAYRLAEVLKNDNDVQVRNFAAISLGKIAGSSSKEALLWGIDSGYARSLQGFSALGLGLLGDRTVAPKIREKLTETYGEEQLRGAFALSLGLLRDRESAPDLLRLAQKKSLQPEMRGYCAVALGLMGYREASEPLRAILRNETGKRDLVRSTSLAVSLLGNREATTDLRYVLVESSGQTVRGAAVIGHGILKDHSAIDPLLGLLRNKVHDEVREMVMAALGYLAERDEIPALSLVARDHNYRIPSRPLSELLRLL